VRPRLAVFCSGNGSNFEAIARAIHRKRLKADLAVLVCDNPKANVVRRAAKYRVPAVVLDPKLFHSRQDYEKFILRILRNQKVDWVILAGFMRILTPHFIRAYRNKILNVHPSLLPAFKGAHAIRDAFRAGVKETGVTVHRVTDKLDSGPILTQKKVKISKSDTLKTLENKIHRVEHQLYPVTIQKYACG
jgi:phosphoribosylglycinamide formyltransferase-1